MGRIKNALIVLAATAAAAGGGAAIASAASSTSTTSGQATHTATGSTGNSASQMPQPGGTGHHCPHM